MKLRLKDMYLISAPFQKFTLFQPCSHLHIHGMDRGWDLPSLVVVTMQYGRPVAVWNFTHQGCGGISHIHGTTREVQALWLQLSNMACPVASATFAFYLDWLPSTSDIADFHRILQEVDLQGISLGEVNP